MTSYLSSWLWTGTREANTSAAPSLRISPPPVAHDDEDDGSNTETEHNADDDRPPAFPSLSSAQRVKAPSNASRGMLIDAELMPPPPLPNLATRTSGVGSRPGSTLAVPLTTTRPPNKNRKREKVALAPGHSPLDWARVKASGQDLRGVGDTLLKIPPSALKQHNQLDDAWTAINGKVYNITPYLSFHPGGEKELMRVAGRDGSKLFALTHAWVNVDFMLDACFVGFLVPEPSH